MLSPREPSRRRCGVFSRLPTHSCAHTHGWQDAGIPPPAARLPSPLLTCRLTPRPQTCWIAGSPQLLPLSIIDPPYAEGSAPTLQYQPQSCFLIVRSICGCSGFYGAPAAHSLLVLAQLLPPELAAPFALRRSFLPAAHDSAFLLSCSTVLWNHRMTEVGRDL